MKAPNEKGSGHGTYVGRDAKLKGHGALLRRAGQDHPLLAQFDNTTLGKLAYGWHDVKEGDFDVDRWDNGRREHEPITQDGGPMHAAFLRGGRA